MRLDIVQKWMKENGYPAPKKEKDFRKVLEMEDVDGIISETPDHFHAYSAVMAMKAGKAVYVEKPCCFCPREGEILVDTWKKTGMVFQMGNQRRSDPNNFAAIKAIREEGYDAFSYFQLDKRALELLPILRQGVLAD